MLIDTPNAPASSHLRPAAWGGVFALSLCAFALIASEFMPVSLLSPIAGELSITEGQAGQAISISGAFAVVTSLVIARVARTLDRKHVLLGLTVIMILSGSVVAFAPSYGLLMVGRALIGVVIGGFWSLSAATAMRLVPADRIPRALAVLNGGNALATVLAAPLGSYLGAVIGWRGAFFSVVPVALVVLVWLSISLPRMRIDPAGDSAGVLRLLRRPVVMAGMAAVGLFFMGQFTVFTYLRPFLESVVHADVGTLSLLLLLIGIAGFVGSSVIGFLLNARLGLVLVIIPLVMAAIAFLMVLAGGSLTMTAVLLAAWGFLATSAPVAWWTWLARTLPKDSEAGGGLMVAVIQLSITAGAALGGVLCDSHGVFWSFVAGAVLLLVAAGIALLSIAISDRSVIQV